MILNNRSLYLKLVDRVDRLFNLINTAIVCTHIVRRNYFSPYVSPHGELCDKHRFTSIYSVGTCQSVLRIVAIKFFIERGWRSCCRLIIQVEKETRSGGGDSNTRENLRSEYRYPLSVNQHR